MQEKLHTYGEHGNLQGIASVPENMDKTKPAVLLLNSGVLHKVGPFDLNVSFARHLLAENIFSFRFDLSGIGDSAKINNGLSHHESVMSDIKSSMSFIESQYGINNFVVVGLCTGADHAHKIACVDERVIGDVWLDGYAYSTLKFKLIRYLPVFMNPKRLFSALKNALKNYFRLVKSVKGVDAYVWELPDKDDYLADIEKMHKRGVHGLYIFSGGVSSYYNYKQQFAESFKGCDFLRNIEVEYYPNFDHTYMILKDRKIMMTRVADWINKQF